MSEIRYPDSTNPVVTDGRDIDTGIGALVGEGSLQRVEPVDKRFKQDADVWRDLPQLNPSDPTYYGRPMIKAPVWAAYIPIYYFLGGAAGASLALGAAVQLDRSEATSGLVRKAHWVGIVASSIGAGFLILDLGRPLRFLNMMRVFRPTSPMNMGAWILAGTPPAASRRGSSRVQACSEWLGKCAGMFPGFSDSRLYLYRGAGRQHRSSGMAGRPPRAAHPFSAPPPRVPRGACWACSMI